MLIKTNMIIDPFNSEENVWLKTEGGLYLPDSCLQPKPFSGPIGIDLFAGAGGFSLGMIQAGFNVIAALEMAPEAIHTYLVNLGAYPVHLHFIEDSDRERMGKYLEKNIRSVMKNTKGALQGFDWFDCGGTMSGSNRFRVAPDFPGVQYMFIGDARKISGAKMLEVMGLERGQVDCVFGGPPCQGFSKSNSKRNCMDPRNSLVFEFARLVCEIHPKTVLFENVPTIIDMVTPEGIPVMDAFCRILEDGDYGPYDSLRKALLSTSGNGAILKIKTKKDKREKGEKVEAAMPQKPRDLLGRTVQGTLF